MLNSRNQHGVVPVRIVSISWDGGQHWDSSYFDTQLPDPVCEGTLLNIGWHRGQAWLAFCNPASRQRRDSLTLRISRDEGRTWGKSIPIGIWGGPGDHQSYSDLVLLRRRRIGILYERLNYQEIVFVRERIQ
jgi:sialidase-1